MTITSTEPPVAAAAPGKPGKGKGRKAAKAEKPAKTDKAAKGGKRKLVLLGVPLVLLVVGLLVVKPILMPAAAAPDLTGKPGIVVELEPITLNLSDGRFLKAGMALQLTLAASKGQAAAAGAAASGTPAAGPAFDGAKALDAAISVLGARSYAQLLAPGGRERAQAVLSKEVSQRYDGEVMKVYFTQFVMQ